MMFDDDDDIFDMMDRIFGRRHIKTNHDYIAGHNKEERLIDDKHIYYTFELRECKKEDILVEPISRAIDITITRDGKYKHHTLTTPYPIIPDKTKVTFKNGILDIITTMDMSKANIQEIED